MSARAYKLDAEIILKAAQSAGDSKIVTRGLALRLAKALRKVLRLSSTERLVLLGPAPKDGLRDRNEGKRQRHQANNHSDTNQSKTGK